MRTINVEDIRFDNSEMASKTKNYPNSGFFIAKIKGEIRSDLVIVDKKTEQTIFICPENFLSEILGSQEKPTNIEGLNPSTELIQEHVKYDGDFILEFSRILLNRK